MIAAIDISYGIGRNNTIPWHLPEDLKQFKKLTTGGTVIMGRNTWDSLPLKPLQRRKNIVITTSLLEEKYENTIFTGRPSDHLGGEDPIWIIGGASIYRQFLPMVENIYLTRIFRDYNCNVQFPKFEDRFKLVNYSEDFLYARMIPYRYEVWTKC